MEKQGGENQNKTEKTQEGYNSKRRNQWNRKQKHNRRNHLNKTWLLKNIGKIGKTDQKKEKIQIANIRNEMRYH